MRRKLDQKRLLITRQIHLFFIIVGLVSRDAICTPATNSRLTIDFFWPQRMSKHSAMPHRVCPSRVCPRGRHSLHRRNNYSDCCVRSRKSIDKLRRRGERFTYRILICPDRPHFGHLSGCTYSENESWRRRLGTASMLKSKPMPPRFWPFLEK